MNKILKLSILGTLIAFLGACNQQSNSIQVGIVNMSQVSQQTGRAEQITAEMNNTKSALLAHFQSSQIKLQQKYQQAQQKFGLTPTEEQRATLARMRDDAQKKIQKMRVDATTQLKNKQLELFSKLRSEVQPIASSIAQKRGMSVVLMQNDTVILAHDAQADLTKAVITAMGKAKPEDKKATEKATEKPTEKPAVPETKPEAK